MYSLCLFVCLLARLCKNHSTDLHNIRHHGPQKNKPISFWWWSGSYYIRLRVMVGFGLGLLFIVFLVINFSLGIFLRPRITSMKRVRNDVDSRTLSWTEVVNLSQNRPLWRLLATSAVIYPDPQGVITPSFHATPPTIWSSKGVIRGVFTGVFMWFKCGQNWHEPIYLLYETNNAQNLIILFSGILLKLLPPDVIFCS